MAIDKQEKIEGERVVEQSSIDDFGFDAEYTESEYTTISGKEQRNLQGATSYNIGDIEIGNIVTGYPELVIFPNNDKDENGEFKRNYQSVRIRAIDHDEYVDLYANIPRRDENGFIEGLNKYSNFFRTGFDLCFSFMRWLDETNVVTSDGEEINRINKINIDNVCKKIDSMDYVKIKIVKGGNDGYNSFIIVDMKNL